MTDPTTRRAEAIAALGGVDNLSETFRILRERRAARITEGGDTICGSIATAAILDLAELAIEAPADEGEALRRVRESIIARFRMIDRGRHGWSYEMPKRPGLGVLITSIDHEIAALSAQEQPCSSDSSASSSAIAGTTTATTATPPTSSSSMDTHSEAESVVAETRSSKTTVDGMTNFGAWGAMRGPATQKSDDFMERVGVSIDLDELCALATEPAATTAADHVKWTGNLCEALGLLSTLKGGLDCGRLTNEPVQCAREIHDHVTQQIDAARAEARKLAVEALDRLVAWCKEMRGGCKPNSLWCTAMNQAELRIGHERAAALESQAKPEAAPAAEPVSNAGWFEPNEHTKNVCAIRRKSDGYWWECNSEHGAGWNDKRIRQAWTAREARLEVERHLQGQDVEIVQLMPEPKPEAAQAADVPESDCPAQEQALRRTAAAAPPEREGDGVLREFVEAKWLENPPELRVRALRELCRRALEGR